MQDVPVDNSLRGLRSCQNLQQVFSHAAAVTALESLSLSHWARSEWGVGMFSSIISNQTAILLHEPFIETDYL